MNQDEKLAYQNLLVERIKGMKITKENAEELCHTPLCREDPERGNNHFFCSITDADCFRNSVLTDVINLIKEV